MTVAFKFVLQDVKSQNRENLNLHYNKAYSCVVGMTKIYFVQIHLVLLMSLQNICKRYLTFKNDISVICKLKTLCVLLDLVLHIKLHQLEKELI